MAKTQYKKQYYERWKTQNENQKSAEYFLGGTHAPDYDADEYFCG